MKRKPRKPYAQETREWAEQWGTCWRCKKRGAWKHGLEIHHCVYGSNRKQDDLSTTIILCGPFGCHEKEESFDCLGLLGCLALKKRYDPKHYSLARVLYLRGRATGVITEDDVDTTGLELP